MVKTATLSANATARVSSENHVTHAMTLRRRPNRSVSGPISTAPMPTPTSPTVDAVVSEASVKPRSPLLESVGITAPITTRSNPSRATATQHRATAQRRALPLRRGPHRR